MPTAIRRAVSRSIQIACRTICRMQRVCELSRDMGSEGGSVMFRKRSNDATISRVLQLRLLRCRQKMRRGRLYIRVQR